MATAEKVTELVPPNSNQHSYEQLPCSKFNYSYKAIYTVFTWRQLVQAVNNSAAASADAAADGGGGDGVCCSQIIFSFI